MLRILILVALVFPSLAIRANVIPVKNMEELNKAVKLARPGDTLVMQNGNWADADIKLSGSGTELSPIVLKAQTAGKVVITGTSRLRLGGSHLVVEGLVFKNGYSPSKSVIEFRINNEILANDCTIKECVIDGFNKPKRMDEDQWVSFYGKRNKLLNCSFFDKKNMGVLLAVILDDESSRQNFHQVENNYFGIRRPLGSNGGEIIRVGVSQHCQFNSNTMIRGNLFENCDGETEIVSIKSGRNIVDRNVFKECQGSVVLRHGDDNTVSNNLFLGNGKEATGGVRVINKGQWVVNNTFYKCRGTSFRSPLAIMNGIPNSPAHRYVQVTDAVIMNNSFIECSPVSFCEGSDTERTLPPARVVFANNIFYSRNDTGLFRAWDDMSGFQFSWNLVSRHLNRGKLPGFLPSDFIALNTEPRFIISKKKGGMKTDSLKKLDADRGSLLSETPGFKDAKQLSSLLNHVSKMAGAKWYERLYKHTAWSIAECPTTDDVQNALASGEAVRIILTGSAYHFSKPLNIAKPVQVTAADKEKPISFSAETMDQLFSIENGGSLFFSNIILELDKIKSRSFIASGAAGSSEHFFVGARGCSFLKPASDHFLYINKSTFADSIIVENSRFTSCRNFLSMGDENDDKGYYNSERIRISHNLFIGGKGYLLNIYRGGNDESTLGPYLTFSDNTITHYNTMDESPLIRLTGVQRSVITNNQVTESNASRSLIVYNDVVRAFHVLQNNRFIRSGSLKKNEFVLERANNIH